MASTANIPKDSVLADIQRTKTGTRVRIFWTAGIFTAFVFTVAIVAAWSIVVTVAPYLFALAIVVCIGFLAIAFYELVQNSKTRHKTHDATRRIIEAEARAKEAQARALEFFTYSRTEGVIRHNAHSLDVLALPASINPELPELGAGVTELDFFSTMTQPKRAYGLMGPQQIGKTWLTSHIVAYWQNRGIAPLVLSQKFDAGDYANCLRFGPDPDDIRRGFDALKTEATTRQQMADAGTPYASMQLCPVILEDWTSMTSIIGATELERFMAEALTVYAGRGILLYLVTHAQNKASFGLGRAGSALKDQLTILELIPHVENRTGAIDPTLTRVLATVAGVAEGVPVVGVPTQPAIFTANCEPALYSLAELPTTPTQAAAALPLVENVTRGEESKILRLAGADNSVSTIAVIVFGQTNDHNNTKVKSVLAARGIVARDGRARGAKYERIEQ